MLHRADAELVGREQDMPGLATLMDGDAFRAELVRQFPDRQIGHPACYYLRYKPGTSCLATYQVDIDGQDVDVYGKAYRGNAVDKIRKPRLRLGDDPLEAGHVRVNAGQALVIHVFPYDKQLVALARLESHAARQLLLERLFPGRRALHRGQLVRLRYKPERRFVARLVAEDAPAVLLKFYTPADYRRAQHNVREIRSRNTLQVAGRIGSSNRHRVLALEWLPGELLADAVRSFRLRPADMETVGAALAEFHAQDAIELPGTRRPADAGSVRAAAGAIASLCPALGSRVHRLAARIGDALGQNGTAPHTLHGDFHPGQILLSRPRIAVLDLDSVHYGDPASDVGNMWAHLERDAMFVQLDGDPSDQMIANLLEGYWATADRRVPGASRLHAAGALLRTAPEAFRRREPDWPGRIDQLVSRSEEFFETSLRAAALPATRPAQRVLRKIPVLDPFGAMDDPGMRHLRMALDPEKVQSSVGALPELQRRRGPVRLRAIRVVRYKPQRRCLVEYHFDGLHSGKSFTLIGKTHARGLNRRRYRVPQKLWDAGFRDDSLDGIAVPRPLGAVDALQMWFQYKVSGTPAAQLLAGPQRVVLARRLAEAIHKLHRANVRTSRRHHMEDELSILSDRMARVATTHPSWSGRLQALLRACDDLGRSLPAVEPCGIHRDFYPEQVLIDQHTLWLVDFDLYCQGDPALDTGNCGGHLIEMALRNPEQAEALLDTEQIFVKRFAELSGALCRSIEAYATLTLVRHIFLSTQYPKRRRYTKSILQLCEQRLGLGPDSSYRTHAQTAGNHPARRRQHQIEKGAANEVQHLMTESPYNVETT